RDRIRQVEVGKHRLQAHVHAGRRNRTRRGGADGVGRPGVDAPRLERPRHVDLDVDDGVVARGQIRRAAVAELVVVVVAVVAAAADENGKQRDRDTHATDEYTQLVSSIGASDY